jgi:hypothetical protein
VVSPLQNERRNVQSTALGKNEDDGGTPGLAHTLSGNHLRQVALRREKLERTHHEN